LLSPEPTSFSDGCLDNATNSNEALAVSRSARNDQLGLLGPGWDMKFVTSLLAAVLLLAGVGASHAAVRIAEDHGGRIGNYVTKFQRLRSSGESVIIDGLCASACTLVLSTVPHNKICVTSHATLGSPMISAATAAPSPIPKRPGCFIRCIRRRCGSGLPRAVDWRLR